MFSLVDFAGEGGSAVSWSRPAWLSLHDSSSPEITRERPLDHIRVGHQEVAVPAPIGTPGVTADELLLRVVVADRRDSVTSKHRFSRLRHRYVAGLGHLLALKALVHREAKHERVARRQTPLELH